MQDTVVWLCWRCWFRFFMQMYTYSDSLRMCRAKFISLTLIVTRLAWMAHKLASSNSTLYKGKKMCHLFCDIRFIGIANKQNGSVRFKLHTCISIFTLLGLISLVINYTLSAVLERYLPYSLEWPLSGQKLPRPAIGNHACRSRYLPFAREFPSPSC